LRISKSSSSTKVIGSRSGSLTAVKMHLCVLFESLDQGHSLLACRIAGTSSECIGQVCRSRVKVTSAKSVSVCCVLALNFKILDIKVHFWSASIPSAYLGQGRIYQGQGQGHSSKTACLHTLFTGFSLQLKGNLDSC